MSFAISILHELICLYMKFEHYLHGGSEEEDFLSIFEKSKMAAKSWDLDQSNYVKNLPMTWGIFSQSFMILA